LKVFVPKSLLAALKKQKYHLVGNHSAVKRCRWFYETLVNNRPCFKQKFYGIKTHQCIQMTPNLFNCTQKCLFCWRAQDEDLSDLTNREEISQWDNPQMIFEGSIKAQLAILSGYKGNPKTNKEKFKEALTPKHAAISLTGEPTLYKHIGELIEIFHKNNFTTFLVSNGTTPSVLGKLNKEPTQLYISLCAPNELKYKEVCRPKISKGWQKLMETLTFLPSFKCPTAIRITSTRTLNMTNLDDYSKLIEKADPTYIEVKAYMHVGFSRLRLKYDCMPNYSQIHSFASQIAEKTGYKIIAESKESRVTLLSKLKKPLKL
jgi:tRNA wybutosine-synthesizing protein 1